MTTRSRLLGALALATVSASLVGAAVTDAPEPTRVADVESAAVTEAVLADLGVTDDPLDELTVLRRAEPPTTTTTAPPPPEPEPEPTVPPAPEPSPEPVAAAPASDPVAVIHEIFGPHGNAAVAVARCESNLNPSAMSPGGGNHGLFQINNVHAGSFASVTGQPWSARYDARANTAFAKHLFDSSGWGPWACKRVL